MKTILFALIFASGFAHAELSPVVSTDSQEAVSKGLDLTGLQLDYVEAYSSCSITSGKSVVYYTFDVEFYAVVGKPQTKQPCQLNYTKNGISTIVASANASSPDLCYEVAERIMTKLMSAKATCSYDVEQY